MDCYILKLVSLSRLNVPIRPCCPMKNPTMNERDQTGSSVERDSFVERERMKRGYQMKGESDHRTILSPFHYFNYRKHRKWKNWTKAVKNRINIVIPLKLTLTGRIRQLKPSKTFISLCLSGKIYKLTLKIQKS